MLVPILLLWIEEGTLNYPLRSTASIAATRVPAWEGYRFLHLSNATCAIGYRHHGAHGVVALDRTAESWSSKTSDVISAFSRGNPVTSSDVTRNQTTKSGAPRRAVSKGL